MVLGFVGLAKSTFYANINQEELTKEKRRVKLLAGLKHSFLTPLMAREYLMNKSRNGYAD